MPTEEQKRLAQLSHIERIDTLEDNIIKQMVCGVLTVKACFEKLFYFFVVLKCCSTMSFWNVVLKCCSTMSFWNVVLKCCSTILF